MASGDARPRTRRPPIRVRPPALSRVAGQRVRPMPATLCASSSKSEQVTALTEGRAGYLDRGHNPRLVVYHETEVTVRADQGSRAVQLQPLGGQRPERLLVVVPRSDDRVHHPHRNVEEGADEVLPSRVLLKLARRGEGQEAVAPTMPARLEAARHAFWSQRLEPFGEEYFLLRTHRALLGGSRMQRSGAGPEELPAISDSGWRRRRRQSEGKRPAATRLSGCTG